MATLTQDLLDQGMELRETHISRVFLGRDRVYKVKKPVRLGFLDFGTLELRRHFCEAEVELNRRLAPGVYLGVVPVTLDAAGVHRLGGGGEPVEWAVEMRRLPDREAADRRLREGRLGFDELRRIAERLARFHAAARRDAETARYGAAEAIEANVLENFEQTRGSAGRFLGPDELRAIERWQLGFLREQRARFESRVAGGRIRDGHGDLRLEHCYIDGGVEIIDCIEFNDRFRFGDVCADVAFLSMDLTWHGRHDLNEDFLACYARAADDYDLYGVVDFYESYRAYVRGKVSSLLEADADASPAARERAAGQARKYFLLSEACTRPPVDPPALYVFAGLMASGKSTVAEQLGELLHAPVLDSDRTRKSLAGVEPYTRLPDAPFVGHYDAPATAAVYAELLRRAQVVLDSRRTAILDASFRDRAHRQAAYELARRRRAPVLFIECVAPVAVCRARLRQRARQPSVSDARIDIFDAFVDRFQPVTELPSESYLRVDTTGPIGDSLRQVLARIH